MSITPDQVTAAYVATREEIGVLKTQIEEKEVVQKKREDWLLGQLQTMGLQNMKTLHGTVYVAVKESVTAGEWDATLAWIKSNDKYEFLNKAVNKTAVLEYMGEKRDNPPPPGVNYSAIRCAQIRKG